MHPVNWLRSRDRGFAALRRAGRTAILMPALFALGTEVIGNADIATFAAFGTFAMLLLVDFSGPMRDRLLAQAALAGTGLVFVVVGTLASRNAGLAAAAMAVVGFGVLFAGVVSSVLAGATTALLLAFILPVAVTGPVSSIPDRMAGWAIASVAGLVAIAVLWPAPARDPMRAPVIGACRALAARLRSDIDFLLDCADRPEGADSPQAVQRNAADQAATAAIELMHRTFLATPYRPTGLSTAARSLVRLVDELTWLNAIAGAAASHRTTAVNPAACAVKLSAAAVLEQGADLLEHAGSMAGLEAAITTLRADLETMERNATLELPIHRARTGDSDQIGEFITSLDPSFRAQELSFAVSQVAGNIGLGVAAEQRTWLDRLLGRQPRGLSSTFAAVQERAAAHVERHSVWLHNSVRGAIGLGAAVLIADLSGVQHSFWVVLGTLSVLRSNALNTGQNVLRGLLGTVAGFVIGAALLVPIGSHTTVLWLLLPVAILLAGVAPAAISFAAGQAAFTLVLVILFNIIAPSGWRVGLVRVEDIAIGCAVSLAVGVLFWPRGAAAALGQALAEAYTDSADYLAAAVEFGMLRCDPAAPTPPAPEDEAQRAAAAARRLDDTFRSYLAERGSKPVRLADVSGLITGVAGLRLAADAVLALWRRDDGQAGGDRVAARLLLLQASAQVRHWYDDFADALVGQAELHDPQPPDAQADARLVAAVRTDLREADGQASATAVRMIWTGDHLDAARRLQESIIDPARLARSQQAFSPLPALLRWPGRLAASTAGNS